MIKFIKENTSNLLNMLSQGFIWISLLTDQLSRDHQTMVLGYFIYFVYVLLIVLVSLLYKSNKAHGKMHLNSHFDPWSKSTFLFIFNLALLKGVFSVMLNRDYYSTPIDGTVIAVLMALAFIGHPLLILLKNKKIPKEILKLQSLILLVFAGIIYFFYSFYLSTCTCLVINSSINGLLIVCALLVHRQIDMKHNKEV